MRRRRQEPRSRVVLIPYDMMKTFSDRLDRAEYLLARWDELPIDVAPLRDDPEFCEWEAMVEEFTHEGER